MLPFILFVLKVKISFVNKCWHFNMRKTELFYCEENYSVSTIVIEYDKIFKFDYRNFGLL